MDLGSDGPVLLRLEGPDFTFALGDQAYGHGLYAAGRKAAQYLFPEERREGIADEAVENPARLLGVHAMHVDSARVFECFFDSRLGDFVKYDAFCLFCIEAECLG